MSMSAARVAVELDGDRIILTEFTRVSEGLRLLLSVIEQEVTGRSQSVADWQIVTEPVLDVEASPNGVTGEQLDEIASRAWTDLQEVSHVIGSGRSLRSARIEPSHRSAIRKIVQALGSNVTTVTISIQERSPVAISKSDEGRAEQQTRYYESYGSEEGIVEVIGSRPRPYFQLRSHTMGHLVKVFFEDDLEEKVKDAWRRDVEVTGLIRYRDNGVPISIREPRSIHVYPSRDEQASPSTFLGAIPDLGLLSDDELVVSDDQVG